MGTNLAIQLTSFVGRERAIAALTQLLDSVRLLTLVGAGGIGKTRLAERVASDLVESLADGVWLVELAALKDVDLVPQAVVAVLGLHERAGESATETLCSVLADWQALLVLDNCEHLIGGCAELVDRLLRACPRLRVLATSREPLGVQGETTWRVPSLDTPAQQAAASGDEIAAAEAVRLFLERARSVLPDFQLTDRNATTIVQICRRLDGIPLAIELAAARVNSLGVEQIEARLDDRFHLLQSIGSGGQRVLERHRTLRATVEWSHDLLDADERKLFRRLSVFAGGWTLEAAESVCSDSGLPAGQIMDVLSKLADRSLVLVESQETVARYRLLETLRQYAAEQLEATHETERFRDRHRDWFLAQAQRAQAEFNGPEQTTWIRRLEREHDNARAALRWSLDSGAVANALIMAGAYAYFWEIRGHLYRSEARRWFEEGLARASPEIPAQLRSNALYWAGSFASSQFDFAAATVHLTEGLRLCERLNDRSGRARSLVGLGTIAHYRGEYERAIESLSEGLRLLRELADSAAAAVALRTLAMTLRAMGDAGRALALATEGVALSQAAGDSHQAGHILDHVGECERDLGHFERSAEAHRQAVELLRAAGCEEGVNTSLGRQARLAQAQGDSTRALELVCANLRGFRALGHRRDLPGSLELIGQLVVGSQPRQAVQLFGAAEALRETLSAVLPPADRPPQTAAISSARRPLSQSDFASAWASGRGLSSDRAVELALSCGTAPLDVQSQSASPLTPRELDVAILVARGQSNRQIADTLVISVRTAEAHVTNVLNKLDLRSRSQLAVWIAEQGLLKAPR